MAPGMKVLGLLGGMTFEATAKYYDLINRHAKETYGGRASAPLFMYSANQEEMVQMAMAGHWEAFAAVYVKAANALIDGGAEAMVICAALAHTAAADIERQISVPVLHIADFVGQAVKDKGIHRVALLGTKPVMEGKFIKDRIEEKFEVQVMVPSAEDRVRVSAGIVNELTTGVVSSDTKSMFLRVASDLVKQGAQGLILGSTDLAFVIKELDMEVPLFDSGTIHALGVAKWATANE